MIYATPYNPVTLQCTGISVDSGFNVLSEVLGVLPAAKQVTPRVLLCAGDGVVFSDFKYCIDLVETIA